MRKTLILGLLMSGLALSQASAQDNAALASSSVSNWIIPGQTDNVSFVFTNSGTTQWVQGYWFDEVVDTCNLYSGGPVNVPQGGVALGGQFSISTTLTTPLTTQSCDIQFSMHNGVNPFGQLAVFTISVSPERYWSLQSQPANWIGAVLDGFGGTEANSDGICMVAPVAGDNLIGWAGPQAMIPLVDDRVYRIRAGASTTQVLDGSIPLWDVVYSNYQSSGFGNNFGGAALFHDNVGGAIGIGRVQGLFNFETWATPNAVGTWQWKGWTSPEQGAFTTMADANNDIGLSTRVLDFDSAQIGAEFDSGRICVRDILVQSFNIGEFIEDPFTWDPPINTTTHRAETFDQAAEGAGTAFINDSNAVANYALTPNGPGSRKTLTPFDPTQESNNAQLFPVYWQTDVRFRAVATIVSNVNNGTGPEGTSPVDVIGIDFSTATNELIASHVTTPGSAPDNMYMAASPRLPTTTGGFHQPYQGFFFGHNSTLADVIALPDAASLRFTPDFTNTTTINGPVSGIDPFQVTNLEVQRVYLESEGPPDPPPTGGGNDGVFQEVDGVVMMEMEDIEIPPYNPSTNDYWKLENGTSGFTGEGYYVWRNPNVDCFQCFNQPGFGTPLVYKVNIVTGGNYGFRIYNRHDNHDSTEGNDIYVKVDDGPYEKIFSSPRGIWTWQTRVDNHGNLPLKSYNLSPGEHTIEIWGRSYGFLMDKIGLWKDNAPGQI